VLSLALLLSAITIEDSFKSWMTVHSKSYKSNAEFQHRLNVYKNNLAIVEDHNRRNLGFTLAMNLFADLSIEEFAQLYLQPKFNGSALPQVNVHNDEDISATADTVDWRTKGAVTAVKDQGQCGSCWAFSTTGSVEGIWFIKKKALVSLSEQQLVDCSGSYGNYGCSGGLMDSAFKYIIAQGKTKGIDTEATYTYTARNGQCKANNGKFGAYITSFTDVKAQDESDLQAKIMQQPVSVAIDASHSSFQFYKSGVYYEPNCSPTQLDHGVLAVGYGTQGSSDYYIVKNSWGLTWGTQGYILMSRNKNNNCGIATMSSFPNIDDS